MAQVIMDLPGSECFGTRLAPTTCLSLEKGPSYRQFHASRHSVASPLLAASAGSLPPLPRRHRLRISPQPFPRLSCFLLQYLQHRIPRCILPIPPTPALLDEFLIEIHPLGEEHVSKGALVLIVAVRVDGRKVTYHGGDSQFAFVTPCRGCTTLYGRQKKRRINARRRSIGRGVAASAGLGSLHPRSVEGGGIEKWEARSRLTSTGIIARRYAFWPQHRSLSVES